MPVIRVELFAGRSREQKRAFTRAVFITTCGGTPQCVQVIFQDIAKDDWGVAGRLASDAAPSKAVDCAYSIEGKGQPVFLVHGIGARRQGWAGLVEHLRPHFQCISYDLRGHGDSPKSEGTFGLDELVALNVFHIYAETEMAPWLREVKVPCLVLTGELDGGCNPRLNQQIAKALPNSELVILDGLKPCNPHRGLGQGGAACPALLAGAARSISLGKRCRGGTSRGERPWKSNAAVHNPPARGRRITSPAPCASTRCLPRLSRRGSPAQASPLNLARVPPGTHIPSARP